MKPLRLELRGFTSFRDPAVLDFEGRRLFAITGPTGAGKSSLLDAMTWALYGEVPRVGRATRQLITHGAKSMAVRFDFAIRGERYRVSRQAPGSVGARLERQTADGGWEPLADRAREVTNRVAGLIGLDFQTFTKTVLLPQGAFDTFLRGDEPQRREILSRLLGLDLYEEVGRNARNRAAGATAAANTLRLQLERLSAASPEAVAALEVEHHTLTSRAAAFEARGALLVALDEATKAAREAARASEDAATAALAADRAVTQAEQALREAIADDDDANARRERAAAELADLGYDPDVHRRLERAAALLEQRTAALATVERAREELQAAESAAAAAEEAAATRASEAGVADAAAGEAAAGRQASRELLAAAAAGARAASAALGRDAEAAERGRAAAEAAATDRDERRRRIETFAERLALALHAAEESRTRNGTAAARREAAAEAREATAAALAAAERESAEAAAALEAAQLRDAAVTLQRSLQPGDPCPVCGEPIEHLEPHPAPALDAARAAVEAAGVALRQSRGEHEQAAATLAAAEERAAQTHAAVAAAMRELAAIRAALADAETDPDALPETIAKLAAASDAERAAAAAATERVASASAGRQELRVLLARLPEALVEDTLRAKTTPDPAAARATLDQALAAERSASAAAEAAETVARTAREASREATADAARATERHEHAALALERASEHLASLGAAPDDPEAALAALHEAEQRATRHQELQRTLQRAEQDCVAAAVLLDTRREEERRAAAEARGLRGEAEAAGVAAEEARARFEAAWTASDAEGPPDPAAVPTLLARHQAQHRECATAVGAAAERLEAARAAAAAAEEMRREAAGYEDRARLAGSLEQELHRNRFIAYVQREAMQLLARDAAERLLQLSNGRYRLAADGDEFVVVDRLNGDQRRSVKTLSGGETFLASLALALSLSERLPEIAGRGGAMALESLFLDEGFGALDQESLDIAIGGLEALAGGRRMVSVISHIPEVAERLPERVEVVKTGATSTLRYGLRPQAAERPESRAPALAALGASAQAPRPDGGVGEE